MDRTQKAAVIDEVTAQIEESDAVFAVDYRGISVPQAAQLRTQLREADATFRVIKNTLSERAAERAGADGLVEYLSGPTNTPQRPATDTRHIGRMPNLAALATRIGAAECPEPGDGPIG